MNQNGGFNSYNNGDGRYTHVDNAYNSGTFMNSELKRTESTPLAPSYPDHKSTSPIELQQHQFQDLTSNSFVPQPEVPQLDLYGHSIQQLLDSPQLGLDCIPTSTQALTNSSASTNPFGMEYAHSFIGTQVIAEPAPMLRSHTSHSSIVSIHSTNGFGFDSTPDLFGLYGPLTQGGYPMQPSISNSSERPQDAQAANVLARLAQAPSNDLFDNELCNNDAVCVEECDPGSIYDCATFDINPCYDPACPDRCEVDGVDMTCEKPHSLNIDTSPAVPSDSDRDSWAASTPQEQFSAGFISKEFNSPWQLCFHEEHMHTGCVNPLDVIKRTDLPVITAANCCCNDPEHKPDPENVIRRRRSHESRQKHKIIRRRTISHQKQLSNAASQEHQYSSAEHSRSSSITFGMLSISPISSLSDFQQDQSMFQSTPIIHMCQWLNSGTSLLCGIRFESTATLQAHVENDHILSIRVSKHKKDRLEHCCHWSTCDAAISGKPFRQVQHLKDHIRTHTLCKSSYSLRIHPFLDTDSSFSQAFSL